MTLRHLKIFVEVCESKTISKACEKLHIVQPSVSYTISEMEKQYNVILFNRINQRLVLTDTGKKLYIKAKELISEFEETENILLSESQSPTLNVGFSITLSQSTMPDLIKKLRESIPDMKIKIFINQTAEIEKMTEGGLLDFAIVEGAVTSRNIKIVPFSKDRLIFVCSENFNVKNNLTPGELIEYPLLLREKGTAQRNFIESVFLENNLYCDAFIESSENQCILMSAEKGMGIGIVPEEISRDMINKHILRKINVSGIDLKRTHSLITHKNKKLNGALKQAYDIFIDSIPARK